MKRIVMMLAGATVVVGVTVMAQEQRGGGKAKEITLPQVETKLPDGPGRQAVEQGCVICHSTRYIAMQPAAFSKEAWAASVDKMRKTFGAPITNEQAAVIVDYLVAVRGAKAAKP